jgi:predicted peptidase
MSVELENWLMYNPFSKALSRQIIVAGLVTSALVGFISAGHPVMYKQLQASTIQNGQHSNSAQIQVNGGDANPQTVTINYLLYLPDVYDPTSQRKWPLILYLHGSGEQGNDLGLLKNHPLPKKLDQQSDFPFIVVSPQLPDKMVNWSVWIDALNTLLEQIQTQYAVDNKRLYLTGISLGGFGTWEFALRYPKRFAAIVPIAGGYKLDSDEVPPNICDLKNLPIWVFHGLKDTEVLPIQSEALVEALKACRANIRFTLYPEAGHAKSWMKAYENPKLYEWLLEQRLP